MLLCVKMDVVRCLLWLDLGFSPCGCGLLGSTPKPSSVEVPSVPRSRLAYPNDGVRPIARDPRKEKASMGLEGARPKVSIKPKLGLNGGCGPDLPLSPSLVYDLGLGIV